MYWKWAAPYSFSTLLEEKLMFQYANVLFPALFLFIGLKQIRCQENLSCIGSAFM